MYFKFLNVLILTAGLVLSENSPKESQKSENSPNIEGGYEVKPPFKYPWMVSIYAYEDHYCGGSLYNDNTVITAAHCSKLKPDEYEVKLHRHNLTKSDADEKGTTFKVKSIFMHPHYNDTGAQNDIAILKLNRPTSNKKTYFDLDTEDLSAKTGTLTKVIGWGQLREGVDHSPILMEVKVPVYNITTCVTQHNEAHGKVFPKSQFCAGYPEGGKDACFKDSGSPLFVEKYDRPILLGIVSTGIGCARPKLPGIYTKVSKYPKWIQDIVASNP